MSDGASNVCDSKDKLYPTVASVSLPIIILEKLGLINHMIIFNILHYRSPCRTISPVCVFEGGQVKVLKLERIYQNRTGCNRLSLCIAWADGPMVGVRLDGDGATVGLDHVRPKGCLFPNWILRSWISYIVV